VARDIVYVMFDIPKDTHKKLKQLSLDRECTLRSMLQESVQRYVAAAPEYGGTSEEAAHTQKHTENELCEAVFYLSRYAECLEIDKAITVPDERELLQMICEWAREFEESFDPGSKKDYQTELETRGPQWLLETFPYMPELDGQRQSVIEFIKFEETTAEVWPWAISAEEILQNSGMLREVEKLVHFDSTDTCDTDELYEALDKIAGVNPKLEDMAAFNMGMASPGM